MGKNSYEIKDGDSKANIFYFTYKHEYCDEKEYKYPKLCNKNGSLFLESSPLDFAEMDNKELCLNTTNRMLRRFFKFDKKTDKKSCVNVDRIMNPDSDFVNERAVKYSFLVIMVAYLLLGFGVLSLITAIQSIFIGFEYFWNVMGMTIFYIIISLLYSFQISNITTTTYTTGFYSETKKKGYVIPLGLIALIVSTIFFKDIYIGIAGIFGIPESQALFIIFCIVIGFSYINSIVRMIRVFL